MAVVATQNKKLCSERSKYILNIFEYIQLIERCTIARTININ